MKKRDTSRVKTIVIAGDRGLAGGYNANIFRLTDSTQSGDIIPIGKRACERYGKVIVSSEKFSSDDAAKLADELCSSFEKEEFDRGGCGQLCNRICC